VTGALGEIDGVIEGSVIEFALGDDSKVEDDEGACSGVEAVAQTGLGLLGAGIAIRCVAGNTVDDIAVGSCAL